MLSVNYVTRGYRVPLYPHAFQKVLLKKTFGCARLVFNHFLAIQKESLLNQGHIYTKTQLSHMLTLMKKDEQFSFLKEVDSVALQSSCENLDSAFAKFFMEHKGFPHFIKKGYHNSYTAKNNNNCIRTGHNCIRLPKLGWVKTKLHQDIEGHIQRVTVTEDGDGNYSLSICASYVPVETLPSTGKSIGIDVGISELLTLSNGEVYNNQRFYASTLDKLIVQQRKLSRMTKGSNNYERQRRRIHKLYRKIYNQRTDSYHKLSKRIVEDYDVIAVETLNIQSMMNGKVNNLNLSDASWSRLFGMLKYKAEWYGKKFIRISQYEPTSQKCHVCGYINKEVKDLSIREWICPECHTVHNRDTNAAINIIKTATKQMAMI